MSHEHSTIFPSSVSSGSVLDTNSSSRRAYCPPFSPTKSNPLPLETRNRKSTELSSGNFHLSNASYVCGTYGALEGWKIKPSLSWQRAGMNFSTSVRANLSGWNSLVRTENGSLCAAYAPLGPACARNTFLGSTTNSRMMFNRSKNGRWVTRSPLMAMRSYARYRLVSFFVCGSVSTTISPSISVQ